MNMVEPIPAERPKALFDQVRFQLVVADGWSIVDAEKISNLLKENGAEEVAKPGSNDSLSLPELTHIISTTSDFPEYYAAKDRLISVTKPTWVSGSIAKGRLANPRQYSPDPKLFFSGLVVCCADLPPGDCDAILGGVLAMGGLHTSHLSKMVTHVVALTLDPDKCQAAIAKNLKCRIVLPHWFDDCLKLGKRIDEAPYCLPDPEILRRKPEDRIPDANRLDMRGSSSATPSQLDPPLRPLTVFKGKVVMLSADLGIGSHLRGTIEGLIKSGGGDITGSVHSSNTFICQYRETADYRIASRAGQDVGNLAWLYHLFTHNKWTYPMRRLLHYPVAKDGLPGFKEFRISLSNYNGEARVYLENLAKAAGGDFTKTMKEDNTHLITAHLHSEKCDAATEWNINIVNHLWLEESYAKWQIQSMANPRYTHFPQRTNLGEVVGQTEIDRQAVEKKFFPEGSDEDSAKVEARMRAMKVKDQNVKFKIPAPNSSVTHPPSPARGTEPVSVPSGRPKSRASKESKKPSETTALRTPVASRYLNNEKENDTPSTTGSRSAKQKAAAKLHDMMPDVALYQKEMKRVGGVVHGGRKSSEDKAPDNRRKRSVSKDEEDSTDVEDAGRAAKKAKTSKEAPAMHLLITGDKRWENNPAKESSERVQLKNLGIQIVEKTVRCTHVAAPRIIRTPKFVSSLSHSPVIVTSDYVEQCLTRNARLNPEDFLITESEEDKAKGYNLAESMARAKNNKGRLLRAYTVYCTADVRGGFDAYKSIVTENGGDCVLYKARASSAALVLPDEERREQENSDSSQPEYLYLISGTSPEEARLWPKFRQMAQSKGRTGRIVRNDWLLDAAIRQEIRWLDSYELKPSNVERA